MLNENHADRQMFSEDGSAIRCVSHGRDRPSSLEQLYLKRWHLAQFLVQVAFKKLVLNRNHGAKDFLEDFRRRAVGFNGVDDVIRELL